MAQAGAVNSRGVAQQRSSVRALAQWAPMEAQSCRAVALAGTALTALVVTLVTATVEAGSRNHGGGRGR